MNEVSAFLNATYGRSSYRSPYRATFADAKRESADKTPPLIKGMMTTLGQLTVEDRKIYDQGFQAGYVAGFEASKKMVLAEMQLKLIAMGKE